MTQDTTPQPSLFDPPLPPCPCCNGTGVLRPENTPRAVTERPGDPGTSAAAGTAVRAREGQQVGVIRPGTQRHRMLQAFLDHELTDSEAATAAGLNKPGICYWKRASELRQAGYIVPTGDERPDPDSGKNRAVWAITLRGINVLEALEDKA